MSLKLSPSQLDKKEQTFVVNAHKTFVVSFRANVCFTMAMAALDAFKSDFLGESISVSKIKNYINLS